MNYSFCSVFALKSSYIIYIHNKMFRGFNLRTVFIVWDVTSLHLYKFSNFYSLKNKILGKYGCNKHNQNYAYGDLQI